VNHRQIICQWSPLKRRLPLIPRWSVTSLKRKRKWYPVYINKKWQSRLVRNKDANIIQLVGIEPTQKARFIDKIITESVLYWQFENETYFWSFTNVLIMRKYQASLSSLFPNIKLSCTNCLSKRPWGVQMCIAYAHYQISKLIFLTQSSTSKSYLFNFKSAIDPDKASL